MTFDRFREPAVVLAGFTLLTVALTYPQITAIGSAVGAHYDSLFSIWRLAWIAHALVTDPRHLFDANIFWPERTTLAFSDAILLLGGAAAPLIWAGVNPVIAYNLLVLASFVTAGAAMYLLVRDLTGCRAAAWFSGVVFAFQAYRFAHYAHLELLWSAPIPLALWAFHRVLNRGRIRDAMRLAAAIALQTWSSVYYAIFLVTALAILAPLMLIGRGVAEARRAVVAFGAGAVVCLVLVGPYAVVYARAASTVGARTEWDLARWSPAPKQYLATTPSNWLYGRWLGNDEMEMALFPGVAACVAAALAFRPPVTRIHIAYALLLVIAVDLSLGVNGLTYAALYRAIPIFRGLRVPARMFVIVSAALSVLGGYGVARVRRLARSSSGRVAIAIGFVAVALLESAAMPVELSPADREPHPIYAWLRRQPPSVVMEWPMPKTSSLGVTWEPEYMYFSIGHWQRLVNGYSGFFPGSYIKFLEETATFPSAESVAYMRKSGVDFVVLHSEFEPRAYPRVRDALLRSPDFELVAGSREHEAEITIYRLRRRP